MKEEDICKLIDEKNKSIKEANEANKRLFERAEKIGGIAEYLMPPAKKFLRNIYLCPLCGGIIPTQIAKSLRSAYDHYEYWDCKCGYEYAKSFSTAPVY